MLIKAAGKKIGLVMMVFLAAVFLSACAEPARPAATRQEKIPAAAMKMTPSSDQLPPILHSAEFEKPVPLPEPINTAGAEDSAFIMPDGRTLYFFFTPDTGVPPEKQLLDEVTGIYMSQKTGSGWSEPQRVWLDDPGKLSLDGCEFIAGNVMWFCSAREGFAGINMFTAEYKNGRWQNWHYVGDQLGKNYLIGEMHVTADGTELYFHSGRPGGQGQYDIWVSRKPDGEWQAPENVEILNTPENEGWPFISSDGSELWFTRFYQGSPSIWRSKKIGGQWQEPELILSQFAGEPTLDDSGNLYFTHHYYQNGEMVEADIYFAGKK